MQVEVKVSQAAQSPVVLTQAMLDKWIAADETVLLTVAFNHNDVLGQVRVTDARLDADAGEAVLDLTVEQRDARLRDLLTERERQRRVGLSVPPLPGSVGGRYDGSPDDLDAFRLMEVGVLGWGS